MEQNLTDNQKILEQIPLDKKWLNDDISKDAAWMDFIKKQAEYVEGLKDEFRNFDELYGAINNFHNTPKPDIKTESIIIPVLPRNSIGTRVSENLDNKKMLKTTNPDEIYVILDDFLLKFPPNSIINVYDFESYWVFKNGESLIQIDSCKLNLYSGEADVTFPEIISKSKFNVNYTPFYDSCINTKSTKDELISFDLTKGPTKEIGYDINTDYPRKYINGSHGD